MKQVALGEVCTLINGGTPDTKIPSFWDGTHAWITPAEMGNLRSPFLGTSRRTLTDEGMRNSSAQLLPKHSVIMSSRAPIGHLIINEIPMASNQGCKGLIPSDNLNYKYLYYFLYANKEYLNELGSGTTFAEISGTKLKTVQIPLPSLEKQREIVEKLDSAFAEIDLLEGNLGLSDEKANQLLQSLLSAAFTSSVVSVELSNPSANQELVMKIVRIGDVCKLMTGGTPSRSRPEYFENGNIKWLVSGDINQGEIFDCDGRITEEAMKSSNTKILPMNSVMIALNGQGKTRGTVALLRTAATCNQSLVSISPVNENDLLPEFLFHNLRMRYQELRRMTGDDGNDRRGLNMVLIRDIKIPLPSLEKQREIVKKLDSAFAEIDLLKAQIKIEKDYATALRQSLLSSAFTQEEAIA